MEVLNREQIRDKMIRLAAEHWGLQENEIESNFDPLLVLIFDAVAGEMESLGYRIRDIQNQLLEELSSLMLPSALLNAQPASCILKADPEAAGTILDADASFSTLAAVSTDNQAPLETEVYFTPIGTVKLSDTKIRLIKIGEKWFNCLPDGSKETCHGQTGKDMIQELYFILDRPGQPEDLEGMQIYFDLKSHAIASDFYYALQNAQLTINSCPQTVCSGYYCQPELEISLDDALLTSTSYTRKIKRETAGIYARQFLTLTTATDLPDKWNTTDLPFEIPDKLLKQIDPGQTLLCRLQLRQPFNAEIIERLQIAVNAFPAINRRLEKIDHATEQWVNIIPLQLRGSYLDLESIESLNGRKYRIRGSNTDKIDEGEAIIRAARISKNSSRDIRFAIKSLLEAIRDESAYFHQISNDLISSRLAEISKILIRLEDQTQHAADKKPSFKYVLLKSAVPGEKVVVSYWSTDAETANQVKAFAPFKESAHQLTKNGSVYSLTVATGGKDTFDSYTQKQMLVRQLSSRGKIISIEDVKLLCYELYGDQISNITVKKNMKILPGNRRGIARYIDITIQLADSKLSPENLHFIENQLLYRLSTEGSFMFPFEITVIPPVQS